MNKPIFYVDKMLCGKKFETLDYEIQKAVIRFIPKINLFFQRFTEWANSRPWPIDLRYYEDYAEDGVSNYIRTIEENIKIYADLNAKLKLACATAKPPKEFKPIPTAEKSNHIPGHAADFHDRPRLIAMFLASVEGKAALEECNLFYEESTYTPTWAHLQDVPFHSYTAGGHRGFKPY